jgi:3-dehydroquinate dehydratase
MLTQFLELTCMDKDAFLQSQMEHDLLERIHYALNKYISRKNVVCIF